MNSIFHRLQNGFPGVCLFAMILVCCEVGNAVERPNIIVIMADDLGYADMSFLPQSPGDVKTPGIDRLAERGVYFNNAYATSPICSPSRCGMITGRYQQRWGNYWYSQGGLPNGELTIPQALKRLGYWTKKIGKTHLNGGPAQHPLDHGFDEFIGFRHHTWDYLRLSTEDLKAYRKRAKGKRLGGVCVGTLERNRGEVASYEKGFTTEIFTEEAIRTIEAGKDNDAPFFIELEYNAVHQPTYVTHPDYARKVGFEQAEWNRDAELWEFPFWDPAVVGWREWHKSWGHLGKVDPLGRKRYLSHLMAMDDGIVRILDTLEKTGQTENTIVVFLSDNGGTINTYSNNAPLRGYKYMFGEGGVKIPMIVSWPGQIPKGENRFGLTSAMDIFPTLLELAGGEVPGNLDGRSLVAEIKDAKNDEGHEFLCFSDGRGTWSIREGDWKLINSKGWDHKNFELDANNMARRAKNYVYPKGLLLFNLKNDNGETTNLSERYPERVKVLKAKYLEWKSQMGTP